MDTNEIDRAIMALKNSNRMRDGHIKDIGRKVDRLEPMVEKMSKDLAKLLTEMGNQAISEAMEQKEYYDKGELPPGYFVKGYEKPKNHGATWRKEEDEYLEKRFLRFVKMEANNLGRSNKSITERLRNLGVLSKIFS